jgi:hypothetical protein
MADRLEATFSVSEEYFVLKGPAKTSNNWLYHFILCKSRQVIMCF